MNQSKRDRDKNSGFITIKDNPITKVGVFPYLGREIGAPDPDGVYYVYRPAEELNNPQTIESFNLLPWVDEHEFLGEGGTPAEEKGVQGTTGENAYFEYPYLKNNLRVYSSFMSRLIDRGKIELSPGYRCRYEFTPGVFEGHRYDAIQRDIRGNHLALVKEGRTGKDVAVQDHSIITIDSSELIKEQTMFTEEQLAAIKQLIQEALAAQNPVVDKDPQSPETPATPAVKPATTDQPEGETTVSTPVVEQAVEQAETAVEQAQVAAETAQSAIETVKEEIAADSVQKAIQQIAQRDTLAKRVTPHIGAFDSASMLSAQQVAEYAVNKLGIKSAKGAEIATLDGYLQHKKAPIESIVKDSKPVRGDETATVLWKEKQ